MHDRDAARPGRGNARLAELEGGTAEARSLIASLNEEQGVARLLETVDAAGAAAEAPVVASSFMFADWISASSTPALVAASMAASGGTIRSVTFGSLTLMARPTPGESTGTITVTPSFATASTRISFT